MTLGSTPRQADVFRSTTEFCAPRVASGSIYGLLHRESFGLFPDELFADLFTDIGRRSIPPLIVAVVMVLQRLEGLSDREAVERFTYDARWKYAAGGLPFDYPGFAHTVLVDMRARLARSERPRRHRDRGSARTAAKRRGPGGAAAVRADHRPAVVRTGRAEWMRRWPAGRRVPRTGLREPARWWAPQGRTRTGPPVGAPARGRRLT